jgi:Replicative DNA helicase
VVLSTLKHSKRLPLRKNTKLFVEHIIQASARREVYETALKVADEAIKAKDVPLDEYLMSVEARFRDITIDYQVSQEVVQIGEGVGDRLKKRLLNPQEVIGLRTGWKTFDKLTQGLKAGELTVVGARSKTGKSVTLLNWCRKISVEDKVPALYIDTEMFTEEQQDRLLAQLSRVPEVEIKNGMFGRDTMNGKARDKIARLQEASRMLKEAPFYHIYLPHFTPEKIVALARKYKIEYGIGLLVFDYIKLPSSGSLVGEKEYQALGYLTSTLKDIAGTLEIPVVSAVQLNRAAVKADEIDESMIAGSDRILQLANRVCFLRWKTEEERALSKGTNALRSPSSAEEQVTSTRLTYNSTRKFSSKRRLSAMKRKPLERIRDAVDVRKLLGYYGAQRIHGSGQVRSTCPIHRGDNPTAFVFDERRKALLLPHKMPRRRGRVRLCYENRGLLLFGSSQETC